MDQSVLNKLSYGLYLVGAAKEMKLNGQAANAAIQITAEPATIAISINKLNLTHEFILASRAFSLSILSTVAPLKLIGHFGFKSGREINKLEGVSYRLGQTGSPIFTDNSLAYIEAEVVGQSDVGTHTIFIGKIVAGEKLGAGEPMTYAYYHDIKKGTSPATAPTFQRSEGVTQERKMKKYICKVCGYVYDPALGDPDGKIPPGIPFEEIPAEWVCPVCGAGKDQFEEVA